MSQRSNRVAEELRKIISMILLDGLSDPRMGFVTITRIELTDDLRFARIFYSILGNEQQVAETQEAMRDNMRQIRKMAIEKINMRYAMEMKFEFDHSLDHGEKIDAILKKLKAKEKEE